MSAGLPVEESVTLAKSTRGQHQIDQIVERPSPMLIGLDVDGTIILQDESESPGVFDQISRLNEAGHVVMLATGRGWIATWPIMQELGLLPDYAVCSNGAVIMRKTPQGYVRDHVELFDPGVVLGLLQSHLPKAHYMVELEDSTRLYTEGMDTWNLEGGREVSMAELGAQPVSRVVVISPGHDEEDFHRLVEQAGLNDVSYAIGWTAWLDIAPRGVNKGTGMERVRESLGISGDRVLVVGDGRNDIEMFEWARSIGGRAVAMGQAPDEVKAAAGEVTDSVENGGLAKILAGLE